LSTTPSKTKKSDTKEIAAWRVVLGDLFALLCAVVVAVFVGMKIQANTGILWLNYLKLLVTVTFGILYAVKLLFLNSKHANREQSLRLKKAYKITKYALKLVLLAIIISSMIAVIRVEGVYARLIVGTVMSNFLFFTLFIWDTFWFMRHRENQKSPTPAN